MMRYMLLIHVDEEELARWPAGKHDEMMKDCLAVREEMNQCGVYVASERLRPGNTDAVTVRRRDNQTRITDGPFAETKELLGGFYMIQVASREEAIEWAAKMPQAAFASIEVRPVWDLKKDGLPACSASDV